jgi:hypothetical protein
VTRVSAKRVGLAVFGGLAAICILTAIAADLEDHGLAPLASLGIFEWVMPVILGASVGVIAWVMLGGIPREPKPPTHTELACPICGRPILASWRLCPYCGSLVQGECGDG